MKKKKATHDETLRQKAAFQNRPRPQKSPERRSQFTVQFAVSHCLVFICLSHDQILFLCYVIKQSLKAVPCHVMWQSLTCCFLLSMDNDTCEGPQHKARRDRDCVRLKPLGLSFIRSILMTLAARSQRLGLLAEAMEVVDLPAAVVGNLMFHQLETLQ